MPVIWRTLRALWELVQAALVAAGVTMLLLAVFLLVIIGVPFLGVMAFARLNTTTVEWPDPSVVTMRTQMEQLVSPPPASSFEEARITTFVDGDKWRCVEYRTSTDADSTRACYENMLQTKRWGWRDSSEQAFWIWNGRKPFVWRLNTGYGQVEFIENERMWFGGPDPVPSTAAVCFSVIREPLPPIALREASSTPGPTVVSWPDPAVVAWREKVEQAYPPDPSWSFSNATMTGRPDGDYWNCSTYQTGVSESDARAYYQKWLRHGAQWRGPGEPYLGKSSVRATEGAVTVCLF